MQICNNIVLSSALVDMSFRKSVKKVKHTVRVNTLFDSRVYGKIERNMTERKRPKK